MPLPGSPNRFCSVIFFFILLLIAFTVPEVRISPTRFFTVLCFPLFFPLLGRICFPYGFIEPLHSCGAVQPCCHERGGAASSWQQNALSICVPRAICVKRQYAHLRSRKFPTIRRFTKPWLRCHYAGRGRKTGICKSIAVAHGSRNSESGWVSRVMGL